MQVKAALRLHDDAHVLQLDRRPGSTGTSRFARRSPRRGSGDLGRAARRGAKNGDRSDGRAGLADAMLALGAHDAAGRVAGYARAYDATKTASPGDPKNYWPTPIGEGYGAALLAADRAGRRRNRLRRRAQTLSERPASRVGPGRGARAQGKDDAAARAAYRAHWKGSRDLTLADLG